MTQKTKQIEAEESKTFISEDEIELIDIFRVIWKWKYFIIIGTAVWSLAAMIISFYMQPQPIYKASIVLKSGINKMDVYGEPVFRDSVEEFKTLIEGELLFKVQDQSNSRTKTGEVSFEEFKITADNGTNTLQIDLQSIDREAAIEKINYLTNMLSERYENRLNYLQDNNEHEILTTKRQLEFNLDGEKFITSKLIDINRRIDRYTLETGQLRESSESKAESKNTLLDYASIVEIMTDLKRKNSQISSRIAFYKKKIEDLEKEKFNKQSIIIAEPLSASQLPIKPNKIRNVMLATMIGLFMILVMSFLIEYISKNKVKILSAD